MRARRTERAPVPPPRSRARKDSLSCGKRSCKLENARSRRRRPSGVSRYAAYLAASARKRSGSVLAVVSFMRLSGEVARGRVAGENRAYTQQIASDKPRSNARGEQPTRTKARTIPALTWLEQRETGPYPPQRARRPSQLLPTGKSRRRFSLFPGLRNQALRRDTRGRFAGCR